MNRSYGYNALGLPITLNTLMGTTNGAYVENTAYNALGQIDQVTQYTGSGGRVHTSYQRELETGRLTGIRTDRDSVAPHTVADTRYKFDDFGNIVKVTDAAPDPVDDTQCFTYDGSRLVGGVASGARRSGGHQAVARRARRHCGSTPT